MGTDSSVFFVANQVTASDVADRTVLEVGSLDPRRAVRNVILPLGPREYTGVDITPGPGVDKVCPAEALLDVFGPESVDVVVTTEMLEHVRDWRAVIHNLKGVLKTGGFLLITTRSRGMEFHGYPLDFWRFEEHDMEEIFRDFHIDALERDWETPGVFLRATRPGHFFEADLSGHRLYSIVRRRRAASVTTFDVAGARLLVASQKVTARVLPTPLRHQLRGVISRVAGSWA